MSDVNIILTILHRTRGCNLKDHPSLIDTKDRAYIYIDLSAIFYTYLISAGHFFVSQRDKRLRSFGDGTRNGSIYLYSVRECSRSLYIFPYCLKSFVCGPVDSFCSFLLPPLPLSLDVPGLPRPRYYVLR